jgi:enoyl-CoA hydratase/3-hydroxyacyl-CoA dehydrogenase
MATFRNPLLHLPARPLPGRVAVIGAGTIGPDIGYYLLSAVPGLELVLVDIAQDAIDRALMRLQEYAAKAVARRRMSEVEAAALLRRVRGATDYAAIRGADWVLEAVTEDLALKQRILAQVEELVAPDALITSNTSSLPAAQIFSKLRHPRRATVTHFFAPAWRNPVVEVVRAHAADPEVLEWLRWFFCSTGKVPLVTADVECFMLDRIFDNWCNDAALCLDRASAAQIDSVAGEFVHAGPFFVLNMANGNRIIVETNSLQADAEGAHYRPAPIFGSVASWATLPMGKAVAVPAPERAAVRDKQAPSGKRGRAPRDAHATAPPRGVPARRTRPAGGRCRRREGDHAAAAGGVQRVARRAERRNPGGTAALRIRPRGRGVRPPRLRAARGRRRRR